MFWKLHRTIKRAFSYAIVKNRAILDGGVFLGSVFEKESIQQVILIGTLRDVGFKTYFYFKLWWMNENTAYFRMIESPPNVSLSSVYL